MNTEVYWVQGARSRNEDSAVVQHFIFRKREVVLLAVADGMGGLADGDLASGYCLERVINWFTKEGCYLLNKNKRMIAKSVSRLFYDLFLGFCSYSQKISMHIGTTCSVCILYRRPFRKGVSYLLFHMGDSRIYQGNGRSIRQMTKDHRDAEGKLYQAVGSMQFYRPDIRKGRIKRSGYFLLCTDGFYKGVSERELTDACRGIEFCDKELVKRRLVAVGEKSFQNGSTDNQTAIVVTW